MSASAGGLDFGEPHVRRAKSRPGPADGGRVRIAWFVIAGLALSRLAFAGTIDTAFLQGPWPKQRVRVIEVGRDEVRWRDRISRRDGLFAGVRFEAPRSRQAVWDAATDYSDIGQKTPGVTAVRLRDESPTRQVIEVDVKVLWKTLTLTFEVERDPPRAIRFNLANETLGRYQGVCLFEEVAPSSEQPTAHARTAVELSTWLKPARPVPLGLLLMVERMTFLQGVREFLEDCDPRARLR